MDFNLPKAESKRNGKKTGKKLNYLLLTADNSAAMRRTLIAQGFITKDSDKMVGLNKIGNEILSRWFAAAK